MKSHQLNNISREEISFLVQKLSHLK